MHNATGVAIALIASFLSTPFMPRTADAAQPAPHAGALNGALKADPATGLSKDPMYQAHKDWGCEVLLCVANPNGPTATDECVPPIHRLRRALAHGHPFPRCTLSNGQDSRTAGTSVQLGFNYYDRCPAGTAALPAGLYAMQAYAERKERGAPALYEGIGDGSGFSPFARLEAARPVVCVGARTSIGRLSTKIGEQWRRVVVAGYERIVLLHPTRQPRIFDVKVDNAIYQRVRW